MFKFDLISKSYSVRCRLMLFLTTVICSVIFIGVVSVLGLHNTYDSLSDLRDKSLKQMFSSMVLGVKTTQISTYATRLSQTVNALEYKEESYLLNLQAQQLHALLDKVRRNSINLKQFSLLETSINLLESSVQELLFQTQNRHLIYTNIISQLTQAILYIQHIKRLCYKNNVEDIILNKINQLDILLGNITQASYSRNMFLSVQIILSSIPNLSRYPDIELEMEKVEQELSLIIPELNKLMSINQRIKFLRYKIDALVKRVDAQYTTLAVEKIKIVDEYSKKVQNNIFNIVLLIIILTLFIIFIILFWGKYIYYLLGKRLYSITQSLKKLSQGDKNVSVPQQLTYDELGDLARAFTLFHQNLIKLERTDALLKEKSELLKQTFLAMRDGLAIFDHEYNLISCNIHFSNFLLHCNFNNIDWSIKELADFLQAQKATIYGTDKFINKNLLIMHKGQEPLEIEYNKKIYEWRVSPLDKYGIVVFLIDRTNRKRLEIDLNHSQKMKAIGQLTGGIAHDFNNFLAVIIGNLELIDQNSLSDKYVKRLQRAIKAAENSSILTQRLLIYARKQSLHPVDVDLNRLLIDFRDLVKHTLPSSIKINLELTPNLPLAYIDPNQLETALLNLIINAKDAIGENEGIIIIKTLCLMVQRTNCKERMLQLSIIDNGCGMNDDIKRKVFEPFFTTKSNNKGHGLGLSMVYGFIRQSKGRIIINSSVGKGTNVSLQLPVIPNRFKLKNRYNFYYSKSLENKKLLLVEDQKELQDTLVDQISILGIRTIICESGEDAIRYLEKSNNNIDYLLSDITLLDRMTGVDLAKLVRKNYPFIKILLMTGNSQKEITADISFPILNKPFKIDDLKNALNKLSIK